MLVAQDYAAILEVSRHKRRTLSFLTALTYDPDSLIGWRAVEAMGLVAGLTAKEDPEFVRIHLRRLQWLLNDESGGIGWRAPEAMGEIIRNQPDLFAEFIPIVISLLDMEEEDVIPFRPGILWAIGRIAQVRPDATQPALPWVYPCLSDPNPQTRGMAVWCLGQLRLEIPSEVTETLLTDDAPVKLYVDNQLVGTTVSQIASQVF